MRLLSLRSVVRLFACMGVALATWSAAAQVSDYHFPPGSGFYPTVRVVLPDGRTLIGGGFSPPGPGSPDYSFFIARFNADGTTDASFNGGRSRKFRFGAITNSCLPSPSSPTARSRRRQRSRSLAGRDRCYPAFCIDYPVLVSLNPDGTLDGSFNGTGRLVISIGEPDLGEDCCGSLEGIQLQGDGKIVVLRGQSAIARVNADGRLDRSFVGTDQVAREIDPGTLRLSIYPRRLLRLLVRPGAERPWVRARVLPGTPKRLLA